MHNEDRRPQMNIVITDITILSKLVDKASERSVDLAGYCFCAVQSALTKAEQPEAQELERMGILHFDELPDSEEETQWLCDNYDPSVCVNELMAIRYAMVNKCNLLVNSPIIASVARFHDVGLLFVNDIKKQTNHWEWFKNQHIQLGKVASLFY